MMNLLEKLFGPCPPCTAKGCGRRMVPLRRGFPIFVCRCGLMKVGERTVSLDGANNKIIWTASGAPTALGDLGMDVTTGRPQAFVGGSAKAVALTTDVGLGPSQIVEATAADAVGIAFAVVTGMTITPVAGTYLVWFGGSTDASESNFVECKIRFGGTDVAASLRTVPVTILAAGTTRATLATLARVTVDGSQAIDVVARRGDAPGADSANIYERQLAILQAN